MSETHQDHDRFNVVSIGGSEADAILSNLRSLRDQIVTAWRERGVVLNSEERASLRSEIQQTCKFLTDLTQGS